MEDVEGLGALQRVFRELDPQLARELRVDMVAIAEPVKEKAEQLAGQKISNMLSPTAEVDWWRMRIGVGRGLVYIAPKQRGSRRGPQKRPNLAGLLETKAMQPAVEEAAPKVVKELEVVVDRLIRRYT